MRAKQAARQLGVGLELVNGLVRGGQIAGYEERSPKGNPVFFVYRDEVARISGELP